MVYCRKYYLRKLFSTFPMSSTFTVYSDRLKFKDSVPLNINGVSLIIALFQFGIESCKNMWNI